MSSPAPADSARPSSATAHGSAKSDWIRTVRELLEATEENRLGSENSPRATEALAGAAETNINGPLRQTVPVAFDVASAEDEVGPYFRTGPPRKPLGAFGTAMRVVLAVLLAGTVAFIMTVLPLLLRHRNDIEHTDATPSNSRSAIRSDAPATALPVSAENAPSGPVVANPSTEPGVPNTPAASAGGAMTSAKASAAAHTPAEASTATDVSASASPAKEANAPEQASSVANPPPELPATTNAPASLDSETTTPGELPAMTNAPTDASVGANATAALPAKPAEPEQMPTSSGGHRLDPEDIALLAERGRDLANSGDIVSARLMLRRAAEAGDAQAALILGATYDPFVLEQLRVRGNFADAAMARTWYEKAMDYDPAEVQRLLKRLASRGQ
jgi:hypothetical protein